jgi:hypothetical protein
MVCIGSVRVDTLHKGDIDNNDDDDDNNNNTYLTREITLHVAQIVNTEQVQHCIPHEYSLFQVYNSKYPA